MTRKIRLAEAQDNICEICQDPKIHLAGLDITFSTGSDDWDDFGFFLCQKHAKSLAKKILKQLKTTQPNVEKTE